MVRRKKSGTFTVRFDPEVHARLDRTATALGLGINGLVNLLVRTKLPEYELLVLRSDDPKKREALQDWIRHNDLFISSITKLEKLHQSQAEYEKLDAADKQLEQMLRSDEPSDLVEPAQSEQPNLERTEP